MGAHEHATTYWNATIGTSSGDESFDGLLECVVSFFNRNNAFCREFMDSGGEIDLILNGHVLNDGLGHEGVESKPKVFEITLYSKFLEALAVFPVTLTIRMWG